LHHTFHANGSPESPLIDVAERLPIDVGERLLVHVGERLPSSRAGSTETSRRKPRQTRRGAPRTCPSTWPVHGAWQWENGAAPAPRVLASGRWVDPPQSSRP